MDGLSAASSAFAIVSIAIQLGDGVARLLKLYSAIQGTPARAAALFEDLELLSLVLSQVHIIHNGRESSGNARQITETCDRKISGLRAKVEKSSAQLLSSNKLKRKWNALKITLKDGEIFDLRISIHQTLSVLGFAQTTSQL